MKEKYSVLIIQDNYLNVHIFTVGQKNRFFLFNSKTHPVYKFYVREKCSKFFFYLNNLNKL